MKALSIALAALIVFGLGVYIGAVWQSKELSHYTSPRNYPLSK